MGNSENYLEFFFQKKNLQENIRKTGFEEVFQKDHNTSTLHGNPEFDSRLIGPLRSYSVTNWMFSFGSFLNLAVPLIIRIYLTSE